MTARTRRLSSLSGQPQLVEHRGDVAFHGLGNEIQPGGDPGVGTSFRHQRQDGLLSFGKLLQRVASALAGDQCAHQVGVEHELAAGDPVQRVDELAEQHRVGWLLVTEPDQRQRVGRRAVGLPRQPPGQRRQVLPRDGLRDLAPARGLDCGRLPSAARPAHRRRGREQGTLLAWFLKAVPEATGVVLDRAESLAAAPGYLASAGVADPGGTSEAHRTSRVRPHRGGPPRSYHNSPAVALAGPGVPPGLKAA